MYNEKVMQAFQNPKNVGEIENASGVGTVGNAKCGDIMRIYLDIDENQIIQDVKFKTFGCGSAIATSSIATEMIMGKTIEEALQLSNKAVVEAVNDVARAASQVQTLAEKNQHQAQIERDALRVVGLAQARFNAGIIAGSRVSEARIPALRERANGLLLQGQWLDASIQLTGALGGGYKR